jgi:hypothetical protein
MTSLSNDARLGDALVKYFTISVASAEGSAILPVFWGEQPGRWPFGQRPGTFFPFSDCLGIP